jgi:hypothetical protein
MKTITYADEIAFEGVLLPIKTPNARAGDGCYVEILDSMYNNLSAMLSQYSKVLVVQFGFMCLDYSLDNRGMSNLVRVIKRRVGRRYGKPLALCWVRSVTASGYLHYHVALMLNGHRIRSQYSLWPLIRQILDQRNYLTPGFSEGQHLVVRDDLESARKAFQHLSYLAKVRTKGRRPHQTKDFSSTRLQRNPNCSGPLGKAGYRTNPVPAGRDYHALRHAHDDPYISRKQG